MTHVILTGRKSLLNASSGGYSYDPLNRLRIVTRDSVLSAVYTYDAGGRRVRSWDTVDGAVDYVYSGLNIIDEVSGGVHEKHIYAGGMHIASNATGPLSIIMLITCARAPGVRAHRQIDT